MDVSLREESRVDRAELGRTRADRFRIAAVIPLYNGAAYIQEALDSVLAQTRPADEIIVVDDGSTDDGPAIVRAMSARAPIRLYTKPNGGQSSARNHGVRQATSDLIAFLDQDDIWYPDHLAELVKPFRKQRRRTLGWVYSDLDEIDQRGQMVLHACLHELPFHHPKIGLFTCLSYDMFVLPSASLVAKSALEAAGGFDEQLSGYEDDDLFLRLFRLGFESVFVDVPLTKWRIHSDGCSYSPRMMRSRRLYLRKLLREFPDNVERGRLVSRDCLAPRFFPHALRDYRLALESGTAADIKEAAAELHFVSRLRGWKVRWFIGSLMPLLSAPRLARLTFPVMDAMRPVVRRVVR